MNKNISMKRLLKGALAMVLCSVTLLTTGCSDITTSELPPTTVDNYIYSSDNNYFRNESEGETKFLTVIDGEVSEIGNYYFDDNISFGELTYKVRFTFSKFDGKLVASDMQEKKDDAYFLKIPNEQDKGIFICLNTLKYNYYPVLFDVRNNSVKDVLAGTGADELWISDFTTSPDFKKYLIVSEKDETVYLCIPHEKSLSDMKVLTGVFDLDGAIWADNSTLILTKTTENYGIETWVYNLDTGKTEKSTDKYILYNEETKLGLKLFGTKYALNIGEKGKVYSVDLTTGEEKLIPKYTFVDGCSTDLETHNNGRLLLVTKTNIKRSECTAYLLDLKEGKIKKQRDIPTEYVHVSYFDESNLIAYSSENSYSVYHMGDD